MRKWRGLTSLMYETQRLQMVLDRLRFTSARADYYDYLSELMEGMQGARTLKEVFEYDARRYGARSVRGRLSACWARVYQVSGGDLYATWLGSFPLAELSLIRAAQLFGNKPLISTLRDLAEALRVVQQVKNIMTQTLWPSVLASIILLAMFLAVPLFTVPHLRDTFEVVPSAYYGRLTRALFEFSALVQIYWVFVLAATAGGGALWSWSMPNLSGPVRQRLEKYSFWRIYRYINSIRFLALLTIVLTRHGATSTQLRTALSMQKHGASPWQNWHVDVMLGRINMGLTGADTFDTGLLDRHMFWFLTDIVLARGLVAGLALTRERLKKQMLGTVARQALAWRWSLLLFCVAGLLGLGLWHYAVIDELRRALMLFYASQ